MGFRVLGLGFRSWGLGFRVAMSVLEDMCTKLEARTVSSDIPQILPVALLQPYSVSLIRLIQVHTFVIAS